MTDDEVPLREVRLLELPLLLREWSLQHGAELIREMELISIGHATGTTRHALPERLLDLAEELTRVFTPYMTAVVEEMDRALERGETVAPEVVYRLPPDSVRYVQHVDKILREVDEYCRAGTELLTLAPPPEITAYREWSSGEVARQFAGHPPTSWPQFAAARGLAP
jgi:hypothetical protein